MKVAIKLKKILTPTLILGIPKYDLTEGLDDDKLETMTEGLEDDKLGTMTEGQEDDKLETEGLEDGKLETILCLYVLLLLSYARV